jgi:hypothetical protein
MTLRRKNLLRLGLFAGLAVALSGCFNYPRYNYGPRPNYAAPYDRGHGYNWRDDDRDHHWRDHDDHGDDGHGRGDEGHGRGHDYGH